MDWWASPAWSRLLLHRAREGDRRVVRRAGRVDDLVGDRNRRVGGGARVAEVSCDRPEAAARETSHDDRDDRHYRADHDGRRQRPAEVVDATRGAVCKDCGGAC